MGEREQFYIMYKAIGHHFVDNCVGIENIEEARKLQEAYYANGLADGDVVSLTTSKEVAEKFRRSCEPCKKVRERLVNSS